MVDQINSSEIVATIREGLLVLNSDLEIQFANASFLRMFDVNAADTLHRKLYDLGNGQWNIPDLRRLLEHILSDNETIESYDVEHKFESIGWKAMRLNARKTVRPSNNSKLILLAIEDITAERAAAKELDRQLRIQRGMVETIHEPLLVLEGDMTVIAASRSFYRTFGVTPEATIGQPLASLGNGQWDIPALSDLLSHVIPENGTIENFAVDHDFPGLGKRHMILNARKIYREGNNAQTLLLAIEDVTERRRIEAEREASIQRANALFEELNHRVMNSLSMVGSIIMLEGRTLSDDECRAAFIRMRSRLQAVSQLYRNLSGASSSDTVCADEYLDAVASDISASMLGEQPAPVSIVTDIEAIILNTRAAVPLALVMNELVTNCVKYAFPGGREGVIGIALKQAGGEITLSVSDNGVGIDEAASIESGLGRQLISAFAAQLNGEVDRVSGAAGTTVRLTFPRDAAVSAGGVGGPDGTSAWPGANE